MLRYAASRVLWSVLAVLAILLLNFIIIRMVPGNPIDAIVGEFPAPQEYRDLLEAQFGLNEPIHVQLFSYFAQLFGGNLGFSFANNKAVLPLLLERAGFSVMLMGPGLVLASVFGVLLAAWGARRPGSGVDTATAAASLIGFSMPVFWLGQLLILLFAVNLGWLPAQGAGRWDETDIAGSLLSRISHLVLPVACITLFYMAVLARVSRSTIGTAVSLDYVKSAFSRGLSEDYVLWRHAIRSVTGPIVTIIGYNFGGILAGAVLTETVFGWPGIGSLFIQSITRRDYSVVQGVFLFAGISVVVANILVDLVNAAMDPRVRAATVGPRRSRRAVVTK
jgi:ABC-type dipeptide/oligopeptide/nickel transport system permease component